MHCLNEHFNIIGEFKSLNRNHSASACFNWIGFFCLYLLWIVFVAFLKINVIFISDTTENEGPVFDDVVV